jgi:hypothetical protein
VTEAVGGGVTGGTAEQIGEQLLEVAPQASAALGVDIMTATPDQIMASVDSREGSAAAIRDEDLSAVKKALEGRSAMDPSFAGSPTAMDWITNFLYGALGGGTANRTPMAPEAMSELPEGDYRLFPSASERLRQQFPGVKPGQRR